MNLDFSRVGIALGLAFLAGIFSHNYSCFAQGAARPRYDLLYDDLHRAGTREKPRDFTYYVEDGRLTFKVCQFSTRNGTESDGPPELWVFHQNDASKLRLNFSPLIVPIWNELRAKLSATESRDTVLCKEFVPPTFSGITLDPSPKSSDGFHLRNDEGICARFKGPLQLLTIGGGSHAINPLGPTCLDKRRVLLDDDRENAIILLGPGGEARYFPVHIVGWIVANKSRESHER